MNWFRPSVQLLSVCIHNAQTHTNVHIYYFCSRFICVYHMCIACAFRRSSHNISLCIWCAYRRWGVWPIYIGGPLLSLGPQNMSFMEYEYITQSRTGVTYRAECSPPVSCHISSLYRRIQIFSLLWLLPHFLLFRAYFGVYQAMLVFRRLGNGCNHKYSKTLSS